MKVSFTVNYKIAISVQFCEVQKNGVGKNISIIHKKKKSGINIQTKCPIKTFSSIMCMNCFLTVNMFS